MNKKGKGKNKGAAQPLPQESSVVESTIAQATQPETVVEILSDQATQPEQAIESQDPAVPVQAVESVVMVEAAPAQPAKAEEVPVKLIGTVLPCGQGKSVISEPRWPALIRHVLEQGEKVEILGEIDGHYIVDGGFIYKPFITVSTVGVVNDTGAGMSVIDQPCWPATIVRPLEVGEKVEILGVKDWHFQVPGGYIYFEFVTV